MAVLHLSGPQILTHCDLARLGFDLKSFSEFQRPDRETSNYASGNTDFPTSFLRKLERANIGTLMAPAWGTKRQRHGELCTVGFAQARSVSNLTPAHSMIFAEPRVRTCHDIYRRTP